MTRIYCRLSWRGQKVLQRRHVELSPAANVVIRFPFIRPDIPPIAEWAPFLAQMYESKQFSNFGPLSRQLEGLMASTWGGSESVCVAASSGTAALAAPLIARGVTGRVILPAFTFPATLAAIRMAGAEPFLVDVSPVDWRMSVDSLAQAMRATGGGSALVLCPFGLRSDYRAHASVVGHQGGLLVVDNAAGLGVSRRCLEDSPHYFEAYSLHATKPFGVGEGGVIFAHRSQEEGLRRALNFGLKPGSPTDLKGWGINGKLSELHAAVGLAVARCFEDRLARRRLLVSRYAAALVGFSGVAACTDPEAGAWQCFPLLLPDPEAAHRFTSAAEVCGMQTRRYYVPALSTLPDVDRLGPCPVAEDLAGRMCCVPVYSDAASPEVDELVAILEAALTDALRPPRRGATAAGIGERGS